MNTPPELVQPNPHDVRYPTEGMRESRWVKLSHMQWSNSNKFNSIPVVAMYNPPNSFTPEEPVVIPLLGGEKLEIGRRQEQYFYEGQPKKVELGLVLKFRAPSHQPQDQNNKRPFECEVVLIGSPHYATPGIELLRKGDNYPTQKDNELLSIAISFMALFNPVKDIDWAKLANPTEQQNIVLQQAGWHPPKPTPSTT